MDEKIIAIFCLCDDLLKAIGHHDSSFPQHLNDAEVMTIALVAASCFQGRHDPARFMLAQHGYMPRQDQQKPLQSTPASTQRNRGNRLRLLGTPLENPGCHKASTLLTASPLPSVTTSASDAPKLYRDETYRGYQASKRRYFYGLKIHLMVTSAGQPVECVLTPGSVADVQVLRSYAYDLPPG